MSVRQVAVATLLVLLAAIAREAIGASWQMKQRDMQHTGRADYIIPPERLNGSFFDVFAWQKPAPGAPDEGRAGAATMVFHDGAGPGGADLVVGAYHWPKGVQGMDRHSGARFWDGNPSGGETIATRSPAFSPDGATIYILNDATESEEFPLGHPLMAFSASGGPSTFRHNGAMPDPTRMEMASPTIDGSGRIFLHGWGDRPYGAVDTGSSLDLAWSAATEVFEEWADPSIYEAEGSSTIVAAGAGAVKAYDGFTGAEIWSTGVVGHPQVTPTIDPANGNIYLASQLDGDVFAVGLDKDGSPLWGNATIPIFDHVDGENNMQMVNSCGCLAHDGATYYVQTVSEQGDGSLYAIDTATGSVRWTHATGSRGWWDYYSSPIVTPNGVVVVGNNDGDTYFAIFDEGTQGTLLDTFAVDPGGSDLGAARSSAVISPDGLLYLPTRTYWTAGNGDGDPPTSQITNLFSAFDLGPEAQAALPPPPWQAATALNHAVRITWQPVPDPSGVFDHYAVYRDTLPFESVEGAAPIATLGGIDEVEFFDATAENGTDYYYAVTSVTLQGAEEREVHGIGPRSPYDETDVQVASVARLPRYSRYAPVYTYYEMTEPDGFGPYGFSAATALDGQDENTRRWPDVGEAVTYRATLRNRGTNPVTANPDLVWTVDGFVVSSGPAALNLDPGRTASFDLEVVWDGVNHEIRCEVALQDARPENNGFTLWSKSVAFLSFIDATRMEEFRQETVGYPGASTNDFIDWLNLHMIRFNDLFEAKGSEKRVHFDVLEVLNDHDLDPDVNTIEFAIFPFRYGAGEGSLRLSGYYDPAEDLDYGLLHEMGHQLGLIDIYQLNLEPSENLVTGVGTSGPACLMNGCSHFLSDHSARAMDHWQETAHGYFGQYLYCLPEHVMLRFLGIDGAPLAGASVRVYQMCERPGMGKVITDQVKFQGTTDGQGEWILPNVPVDPLVVPPAYNGDTLHDNPFGYLHVIGTNGLFLVTVEADGFTDACWLDVTEVNDAYWGGSAGTAVFVRHLLLGGTIQVEPPEDMAELNAASWVGWADGGSTTIEDDTSHAMAGEGSVLFTTDGGFDTSLRYPGDRLARWDLTRRTALRMWVYAENEEAFQDASPWILLKSANGHVRYQTDRDILNEAIGQWVELVIPLAGDDLWHRTEFGNPDLAAVSALEFHADTWGSGFRYWIDGVRFDRDPAGAPGGAQLPRDPAMHPAAPNPFAEATALRVDVPNAGEVQLRIYDAAGRHVRTLLDGPTPSGRHVLRWDGRDLSGRRLAAGTYFARLTTSGRSLERKVTLR